MDIPSSARHAVGRPSRARASRMASHRDLSRHSKTPLPAGFNPGGILFLRGCADLSGRADRSGTLQPLISLASRITGDSGQDVSAEEVTR